MRVITPKFCPTLASHMIVLSLLVFSVYILSFIMFRLNPGVRLNSVGPSAVPWGTPHMTAKSAKVIP